MQLAIFDFNGTIFPRETLPFLLTQWYKLNYSKSKLIKVFTPLIPLYLRYKLELDSNLSKEQMERGAVKRFSRIFKGMTKDEIQEFFCKAESSAEEYYNKEVVNRIEKANKNGYHTILLSGAFRPFLVQVGKKLNFDTVIGSKLFYKNDLFDSQKKVRVISGNFKVKELKKRLKGEKINWNSSYAYADSYHDLELLEIVGNPVAVDPDDRLAALAKKRGWEIIK